MDQPPFETKKDYILRRVKQKILDGEYGPGDRLKVRQLATEFGTSEIPVREAINQLASMGLVILTPHVGAIATPVSSRDLQEIFDIRTALEGLAIRLATPRITPEALTEIGQIATDLERAVESTRDADELGRLNRAFHMAIYRYSHNERLLGMIEDLWNHAGRYPSPLSGKDDSTYQSLRDHQAILDALRDQDVERAAAITEEHKNRSMLRIIAQVKKSEASTLQEH